MAGFEKGVLTTLFSPWGFESLARLLWGVDAHVQTVEARQSLIMLIGIKAKIET